MKQIDRTAKIWEPVAIVATNHEIIIGPKCRIGQFVFIACKKLVMEEGSEISPLSVLGGGGSIHMGKYSTIDYGAKLIPGTFTTEGQYMNDAIPEKTVVVNGSITLGEGACIGAGAVICVTEKCPNITIGDFAVIGANSYIDKSVEPHMIVHPKITYQVERRKTK